MEYIKGCIIENYAVFITAIGILIVAASTDEASKKIKVMMHAISILMIALSIIDYAESVTATWAVENTARYVFSWLGYTIRPIVSMLFFAIVTQWEKKANWAWALSVLNSLVYATTFIPYTHKWAFYYSETNEFFRGPLGYTCQLVGAIYIILILVVVYKYYSERRKYSAAILLFCALATALAVIIEMIAKGKVAILNETMLISCLFFFLFLHSRAKNEEVEEKDLMLSDQRAAMVVQEIHPRFIYDVLTRIQSLVKREPERAEFTLHNLVTYLEKNMETTDFVHPIPFEEELERVKAYIRIEQARLPNLDVVFDIEDTDFVIPALTVQHMVENSIQHGFDKMNKGTVTIKTFCSESGHTIIIQDDGRGFSSELALTSENQGSRFGIANVTERLDRMVGGDINIVTKQGSGTTVMISVPNEQKKGKI